MNDIRFQFEAENIRELYYTISLGVNVKHYSKEANERLKKCQSLNHDAPFRR